MFQLVQTIIDKRKKQGFAKTEQNLLSLMMRADSEHGYDLKDEDLLDDSITLLFGTFNCLVTWRSCS